MLIIHLSDDCSIGGLPKRIIRGFRTVVKIVPARETVVATVAVTKPVVKAIDVVIVIDRRQILNFFSRPGKRIIRDFGSRRTV